MKHRKRIVLNDKVLAHVMEFNPASVVISDKKGIIHYVNQRFEEITGYTSNEVIGKNSQILSSLKMEPGQYKKIRDQILSGKKYIGEHINQKKDGTFFWELVTIFPIMDKKNNITQFLSIKEDITFRKFTEEYIVESEQRYALTVAGASGGIWDWKFEQGIVYLSKRWKEILGYNYIDIKSKIDDWYQLIHREDIGKFRSDLQDYLDGKRPFFENESRYLNKNGTYRWILCRGVAIKDESGNPFRMAGSIVDISQEKEASKRLLQAITFDSLTNLPNRNLFLDRLANAHARSKRKENYIFAVLYINIDRFKDINDSQGYNFGDQIIKEVSRKILQSIRDQDTAGRFGGSDFVLLLDDVSSISNIIVITKRIMNSLKKLVKIEDEETVVSASIGISTNLVPIKKIDDFIRFAHIAMSSVKKQGGSNYLIYQKEMDKRSLDRWTLENRLYHALKNNDLFLHYQPKIDLVKKTIFGFEALVRWRHGELGMIPPPQFIPLAESSGLIVPLGEWILKTALKQNMRWHKLGFNDLIISVNFSARQFQQNDFATLLERNLKKYSHNPSFLEVEVTESILINNADDAILRLKTIKALGVILSIDDFGTGFSSLNYLTKFPLDILKIDQTFLKNIPGDLNNVAIISTIIALAKNLGLDLIAEGVENYEQLKCLMENGCTKIQGYYISKPLPKNEASDLLTRDMSKSLSGEGQLEPQSYHLPGYSDHQ